MFDYDVCNQADSTLFYKQCRALEAKIPGLRAEQILEDVDGTLVKKYAHSRGSIMVKNDMQVDALYVVSDFDLRPYFAKN